MLQITTGFFLQSMHKGLNIGLDHIVTSIKVKSTY